tara:strand:- start:10067 stop:10225 length:159 start_codon:yes stop_codon:yes gene_type:complete
MKVTVVIQDVSLVVNAQGQVSYRSVQVELTPEQEAQLSLQKDEYFGIAMIDD